MRARAAPFPAAASRASFFACLRRESSDGRAGRSRAADIAPPFTDRLYPLRDQAERRCTAPRFRPRQVGMLPLPRVGGALSGALERSIAGTGARVKPRVRVRPRLGREHRVTIISQIWRLSGEERVGRKKMIEVGIPPLRGQPVEQQAFCGAECIDARALRLGEIDLLELPR